MNNPALLLADEPTGNLDSENSKEIIALLRKFNKDNNQTVIIITHDDKIALSADRVITIEDGQITRDSGKMSAKKDLSQMMREDISTERSAGHSGRKG